MDNVVNFQYNKEVGSTIHVTMLLGKKQRQKTCFRERTLANNPHHSKAAIRFFYLSALIHLV